MAADKYEFSIIWQNPTGQTSSLCDDDEEKKEDNGQ